MTSISPRDIAILNIKGPDDHCIISRTSKNEAINLMQILINIDLTERKTNSEKKHKNLLKLNIRSNFEAVNLLQILI